MGSHPAVAYCFHIVDDSTAVIRCVEFAMQEDRPPPFELGTTVCVVGRLTTYRDERQVIIRTIQAVDPNQEVLGWLERLALRRELATAPIA
ncbi:hypothetical protein GGF46_003624 [Coemansia sp. RSA 552]|nr:hypothetical protein GGF46_003624 [Coemansia sp. RSA 552]